MYVQLKDDKVKQSFKPNVWTPMVLNGQDAIDPTREGNCFWEAQLHLTLPITGRPTYVKMNYSIDKVKFNEMIQTYYAMMGWDDKGVPRYATLLENHLEWVTADGHLPVVK